MITNYSNDFFDRILLPFRTIKILMENSTVATLTSF